MKLRWFTPAVVALGCYTPVDKVTLRVDLPEPSAARYRELEVQPHIAEVRRESRRGVVVLELKREARHVRLSVPGGCPLALDLRKLPNGGSGAVTMRPLFELGPTERVVGLGQAFTLRAIPGCPEAQSARTSFAVTSGAPLEQIRYDATTRTFSATTRAVGPRREVDGIVAVSAHQQRLLRSELTFTAESADGLRFERVLGVSPVARSSGLFDVGTDHPVLLSGDAWRLTTKPPGSNAELRQVGPLFELLPDVPGKYRLTRPQGTTLSLRSGRFDETPLDCGRADCHREIAESAAGSPMTRVLASDLGGCHSLENPECASACHATGEPGTNDGGFVPTQRELGLTALPAEYEELPAPLRRLGGVGCLACHGPSRIPEPDQRLTLLRSDVCAVCHDLPPRYGHVQALSASRMGHADSAPELRENPSCARCHTGFGALGRTAPAEVASAGITCVTCHDVHPHGGSSKSGARSEAAPSLLRELPLPASLSNPPASFFGVSRVCVGCHAPSSNGGRPEASAAALIAGRGGVEPLSGKPLERPGPHAQAPRGCLACHDSGPKDLVLGKNHAFQATNAACAKCHDVVPGRNAGLFTRARELFQRLVPSGSRADTGSPWHALPEPAEPTAAARRALQNVLLVLEDPAADVHHPSYAQSLLDESERFLSGAEP